MPRSSVLITAIVVCLWVVCAYLCVDFCDTGRVELTNCIGRIQLGDNVQDIQFGQLAAKIKPITRDTTVVKFGFPLRGFTAVLYIQDKKIQRYEVFTPDTKMAGPPLSRDDYFTTSRSGRLYLTAVLVFPLIICFALVVILRAPVVLWTCLGIAGSLLLSLILFMKSGAI